MSATVSPSERADSIATRKGYIPAWGGSRNGQRSREAQAMHKVEIPSWAVERALMARTLEQRGTRMPGHGLERISAVRSVVWARSFVSRYSLGFATYDSLEFICDRKVA